METIEGLDNDILSALTDEDELENDVVDSGEHRRTVQEVLIQLSVSLENLSATEKDEKQSVQSTQSHERSSSRKTSEIGAKVIFRRYFTLPGVLGVVRIRCT